MRSGEDDQILLDWLEAEDLNLICDLLIQRQSEISVQYGFGPEAEARRGRYGVRSARSPGASSSATSRFPASRSS